MSKLTTRKTALDSSDLPGFGRSEKPESPEEYAKVLGIPLRTYTDVPAMFGSGSDEEWSADIELVNMGKDSSYGLAGAPIHFGNTAFCVMVVLKQHGEPVLMTDPHQWEDDVQVVLNVMKAQLDKGKRLMDKADDLGGGA
jgi:hypothetical protein